MQCPRLSPLLCALLATSSLAVDRSWDGNGSTATWNHIGLGGNTNWNHPGFVGTPVLRDGDVLFFGGSARLANTNDLQDLSIGGLVFKPGAGSFTLGGNALTSTGDILNASGLAQRLTFAMLTVGADQLWDAGSGALEVQGFKLDRGSLRLQGAVLAGQLGATTVVGGSGAAALQAGEGGRVRSGTAYLGDQASGRVSLDMGARWEADGIFYVGTRVGGELALTRGGSVLSEGGNVGRFAGSIGTVSIDAASQWNARSGALNIGLEGQGSVTAAGLLFASGLTLGHAGGRGVLQVAGRGAGLAGDSTWAERAIVLVGGAGHGAFTLADGAEAYLGTVTVQAPNAGLDGRGSVWLVQGAGEVRASTVAIGAHGRLRVENSALALSTLSIGDAAPGVAPAGTATVQLVNGTVGAVGVSLGAGQSALLSVDAGSSLGFYGLTIGARGRLLLDGGSLTGSQLNVASGGQLDWRSGTVSLLTIELGPASPFGTEFVVPGSSVLQGQVSTTLGPGTQLNLGKPGATLRTPSLTLDGGSVAGPLSLDDALALSGYGAVHGRVSGGQSSRKIVVDGGSLSLGDAGLMDAVVLGTAVEVRAGRTLSLLSANAAQLGTLNTLGAGARLVSANGAVLAGGEVLEAGAGARVQGPFVNHGQVRAFGAGVLSFEGAVSGGGSFAGHVAFSGRFTPGAAGNSFGGGDVDFGVGSELRLNLDGSDPVALRDVGAMSLQGSLRLDFEPGFGELAAAGLILDLADFSSFSGSFSAAKVQVSGFDAGRLDFSRFTVDGTVAVTAVPEPGRFGLAALGLLVLLAYRRRLA